MDAPVLPLTVVGVPWAPRGMVKFRMAAPDVPELVTDALDPAAPVVTLPTVTVAAAPWGPRTLPRFTSFVAICVPPC